MKKILINLILLGCAITAEGQTWSGSTPGTIFYNQGSVAIGSSNNRGDDFHVNTGGQYFRVMPSGIGIADADWTHTLTLSNFGTYSEIFNNSGKLLTLQNQLQGSVAIGSNNNRGDKFHVNTGGQFFRVMHDGIGIADAGWSHTLTLSNFDNHSEIFNNSGKALVLQKQNGNVGIGTISPAYKLDVIGTIRAREIKVDLNGADFVFENDYKLMPLNELEKFVKERKHLPEITPAKEMEANGTNLGNLNSKLLQKIEELTLYAIEQNKKILELEKQSDKIKTLEERIERLSASLDKSLKSNNP